MSHDPDGSFQVKIDSSGVIIEIPPEQSIVETLEQHGIDVTVSCEQGICGTCLTGVVEGELDHRDSYKTDDEHAANDMITVCCSRSKSPLLVLDL